MKNIKIIKSKSGQGVLGIILIMIVFSLVLTVVYFNLRGVDLFLIYKEINQEKAFVLAEAGITRALFEIRRDINWSGTINEVFLGDGSYEVKVTNYGSEKIVDSWGYVPNKSNPKSTKVIRAIFTKSPGISSFNYASQAGFGGVELSSNAIIFGNVYSNSYINCYSNSYIDGDGFAVGSINPSSCPRNQSKSGVSPVPLPEFNRDYWISKAESGGIINNNVSYDSGINYLGPKRINGNLTINTNATLILTGPLYVNGTVEVNSNAVVKLDDSFDIDGTIILADKKISINNNAQIQRPNSFAILRPNGDVLTQWNVVGASNHWSAINDKIEEPLPADTSNYIFSTINGQRDEFTIETISNATSVSEITVWAYARNTSPSSGDSLGINLIIDGNAIGEKIVSLTNNFSWVNARFSFNPPLNKNQLDNLRVRIEEKKVGAQDSVEVAALYLKVKYVKDNAGYILFVSDSPSTSTIAIELNGNAAGGGYYARYGILQVNSNSHPIMITAYKLILNSNAQVWYDEGFPSQSFTSGPGGTWDIKPGSFIIIQ